MSVFPSTVIPNARRPFVSPGYVALAVPPLMVMPPATASMIVKVTATRLRIVVLLCVWLLRYRPLQPPCRVADVPISLPRAACVDAAATTATGVQRRLQRDTVPRWSAAMGQHEATRTLPTDDTAEDDSASSSAFLFAILESHRPLAPSARIALGRLHEVLVGRGASRSYEPDAGQRIVVRTDDGWMSTEHARFVNVLGSWTLEDLGSKNGSRVNGEPATRTPLEDGD